MEEVRTFKLPMALGTQTIRLDPDSLDYAWKGSLENFRGTLPYENLRVKTRITRTSKASGNAAIIAAGLTVLLITALLNSSLNFLVPHVAVFLLNLIGFLIYQHLRSDSICVQIEPRPFGFSGELAVPDTEKGRAFLNALEASWEASLRRRFLDGNGVDAVSRLQRISWLHFVRILTDAEASSARAQVENEDKEPSKLIQSFAVN
jgi:hypothetical protein